jgi:hypothetical protein
MNQITISLYLEQEISFFRMKQHLVQRLRKAFPSVSFIWCRSEASFKQALPKSDVVLACSRSRCDGGHTAASH